MTIQGLINKIFRANQTQNNTVSWSGSNGLKSIQEDIVDTIRQRTFFTVPTTADLLNQGFSNAVLCYVQDNAFYRWEPSGIPNGTTIFPANDGGVWVQETIGDTDGTVTSIGLSMPAAFTVANSPVTTSGVIGVTAAGTSAQYIKGDGTLGTLPTSLISGSGTTNYVSKWSNTTTLTDGIIYDNGTYTGIGTTNPLARVHIKVPANNPQRGVLCLETTNAGANPFQSFWSNNAWVGYIDVHQNYFNIQSITNGLINLNPSGGNVTVGSVTNAGFKFDVIGTFRATSTTTLTSLSGAGTRMVVADAAGILSTQAVPTGTVTGSGTTNYVSKWSSSSSLTNSLIYDDGTNVGIGTTSPIGKLDVDSTGYSIYANNSSGNRIVKLGTQSSSGEPAIQATLSNGTPRYLLINPDGGNVLIGTTTDNGAKLQVNGLSYFGSDMFTYNNGGIFFSGMSSYGSGIFQNPSNSLILKAGSVDRLSITSTGNVGIGTLSPNFASAGRTVLDINGSSNTLLCFSAGGTPQSYLYQAGGDLNISNEVSGAIKFYTSGSERMRVVAGGNVLIGTATDAGYKLDVNGTGRFQNNLTLTNGGNIGMYISRGTSTSSNSIIWQTASTFDWFLGSSPLGTSTSDLSLYSYGTSSVVLNIARSTGVFTLSSLSGSGTRMVVADSSGILSTQTIPVVTAKSYGAWQTNTTQTAAVNNTGYGVKFDIGDITGHGVVIQPDGLGNNTLIKFVNAGTYNIQFSFQFQNADNQLHDVSIWLRKNGTTTAADVAGSGGFVSVPNSHGGTPGHCIVAWNYFVEANAADFFQLVWSTNNATNVTMEFYPAGSPPPSSASAILTVNQVD
jgi:hypothetical protein